MNKFYILSNLDAGPTVPTFWSYSQLLEWRNCPKRWWLLRSKWPNIDGKYPRPITSMTLHGLLLHNVIDSFGKFLYTNTSSFETYLDIRASFQIRKTLQNAFRSFLETECPNNPRIDKSYLKSRTCFDDIINHFKKISSQLGDELYFVKGDTPLNINLNDLSPKGYEYKISIKQPPITGRLDYVNNDRIIDFKSGNPEPSHINQLEFYALLYWLKTGSSPKSLELIYSSEMENVSIEVPTIKKLQQLKQDLQKEIDEINSCIINGLPEAHVADETCQYCPCRQNCEDYWEYLSTKPLNQICNDPDHDSFWIDIEILLLPQSWKGVGSCVGKIYDKNFSELFINIDRSKCPDYTNGIIPQSARILGAQLRREKDRWTLKCSIFTEVFWIY